MAAPVAVARVAPSGFKLRNGYQAWISFALDTDAKYYEIDVGVPGFDIGDPVENTTQQNQTWRTTGPRSLITLTPFQVKAAYDPQAYTELLNIAGLETTITILFPDNSTLAFFGFLKQVEFDQMSDGTMPALTMTIVPTNVDPAACVEAGPTLVAAGTC